jgi:FMN phosphatase YigB (HAD superfamily)
MPHPGPLQAVFFDIGGTLGTVAVDGHRFKLEPFPSSPALLQCAGKVLGLRVGIITNIPPEMTSDGVRRLLDAAGLLSLLDDAAIVTSRDAGVGKPKLQIFRFAAQRVGLPISQCLYVGEDPKEVAGAQAAGMAGVVKPSA